MKPVFEYLDYRLYLKDLYEHRKATRPLYSYRMLGYMAGVDGSYLAKVMAGTRHIADESIRNFAKGCGLKDAEVEYFKALVHYGKAKSEKKAKAYHDQLLSFRATNAQLMLASQFEYYGNWYHTAVRLILEYYDFRGDCAALAAKLNPPITPQEAEASVVLLTRLGLIEQDEEGRYHMTNQAITTGAQWHSQIVEAYQEATIRLSSDSIKRFPKGQRDVSSVTINIGSKEHIELRKRIRSFRKSLINFVSKVPEFDRTYQLNIQFFPVSKVPGTPLVDPGLRASI